MLAGVHLIAEPWDLGPDGYQVGASRAASWSGTTSSATPCAATGCAVARAWAGGELVRRFMASSDMFHHGTRQPTASVNFIAAHDGFTAARRHQLLAQAQPRQRRGKLRRPRRRDLLPTLAPKARRRIPPCATRNAQRAPCWPRCCWPRARPCSPLATRLATPQAATTTPTVRTTPSAGSTGLLPIPARWTSCPHCWRCVATSPRCATRSGSPPPRPAR